MDDETLTPKRLDEKPIPSAKPKFSFRKWFWLVLFLLVMVGVFNYLIEAFTMSSIKVGDRAPDFSITTHTGEEIRLSDFRGEKAVVVYFYPKDNTSVCTAQACAFRDAFEQFKDAGAEVIGVSGDSPDSHRGFAASQNLPFHLVSDKDRALRKAFGVPKTFGLFPGRVTYVIDREGIVRHIFNSQMNAERHITESLQILEQL